MNRNSRIIISISLVISCILLARLAILFPGVITTTDTPGIYLLLNIAWLIFFCVTFFFSFKYIRDKDHETITKFESIAALVQLISVIFLLLQTTGGFSVLFGVSHYLGYLLIVLGGIAYYRTKHNSCISFLSWGISILMWGTSFYYGIYTTFTVS